MKVFLATPARPSPRPLPRFRSTATAGSPKKRKYNRTESPAWPSVGPAQCCLATVMLTGELVVAAPELSVARAYSVWLPDATFFQVKEYGAAVSVASTVVPSRKSTFVTLPSGSLAVADIVMVGLNG